LNRLTINGATGFFEATLANRCIFTAFASPMARGQYPWASERKAAVQWVDWVVMN
jgi:hypothetical protein